MRPGASSEVLAALARDLELSRPLPGALETLYAMNDGQAGAADGIFPGETWGPNLDSSPGARFLPVADVPPLYRELLHDPEVDVFRPEYVPFAHDGAYIVYCVEIATSVVVYLLVGGPDIFLPTCWQTHHDHAATTLAEFLEETCLRRARPGEHGTYLLDRLATGTAPERKRVARELGSAPARDQPGATRALIHALADEPETPVRYVLLGALATHPTPAAEQALRAAARDDPDAGLRTEAIRFVRNRPAILKAVSATVDGAWGGRDRAESATTSVASVEMAAFLAGIITGDPTAQVRLAAVVSLGKLARRHPSAVRARPAVRAALPVIRQDLAKLDPNFPHSIFAPALALLRLEGPGGVAERELTRLREAGVLYAHQEAKVRAALESTPPGGSEGAGAGEEE